MINSNKLVTTQVGRGSEYVPILLRWHMGVQRSIGTKRIDSSTPIGLVRKDKKNLSVYLQLRLILSTENRG